MHTIKDSRGFMLKMEISDVSADVCLWIVNDCELARKHADHIRAKAPKRVTPASFHQGVFLA